MLFVAPDWVPSYLGAMLEIKRLYRLTEKRTSGEFSVRISPEVHRALAIQAAEQGVSLNRLASAKLAR
jgi:predicted HicB family RNase H-like nuclease